MGEQKDDNIKKEGIKRGEDDMNGPCGISRPEMGQMPAPRLIFRSGSI
jgi:hypothetical protein